MQMKIILLLMTTVTLAAQPPLPTLPVDYYGVPRIGNVIPDSNWKTTTGSGRYPAESYWAQSTNRMKTPHAKLNPFGDYGFSDLWIMRTNSRIAGQWPRYQLNFWLDGHWEADDLEQVNIKVGALNWYIAFQRVPGWVRYSIDVPPATNSTLRITWEVINGPRGRFSPLNVHLDAIQWMPVPVQGPTLRAFTSGQNLVIWWNTAGVEGYRLVRAPNITGPWSSFAHTRATNFGTISVLVPMTGSRNFYRLVNP